jgi:hypothetical protein
MADHDDARALALTLVKALTEEPRNIPEAAAARFDWSAVLDSYRSLYNGARRVMAQDESGSK